MIINITQTSSIEELGGGDVIMYKVCIKFSDHANILFKTHQILPQTRLLDEFLGRVKQLIVRVYFAATFSWHFI